MDNSIIILDTSFYLVWLEVPEQEGAVAESTRNRLIGEFIKTAQEGAKIIIPLGTVIEVGNNIARSKNGRRHGLIRKFIKDMQAALDGNAPYSIGGGLDSQVLLPKWLRSYQEYGKGGIELGDVISICEYERCLEQYPHRPIRIWSTDSHLVSYDYSPSIKFKSKKRN